MRDNESGGNHNESTGKEVEVVLACDEKRGTVHRKKGDGNESTVKRKKGSPKSRWLDKEKDDIKEKGLLLMKCTTVLLGGVCHRTSTPHKSGKR